MSDNKLFCNSAERLLIQGDSLVAPPCQDMIERLGVVCPPPDGFSAPARVASQRRAVDPGKVTGYPRGISVGRIVRVVLRQTLRLQREDQLVAIRR